jgi:hypothetical protein
MNEQGVGNDLPRKKRLSGEKRREVGWKAKKAPARNETGMLFWGEGRPGIASFRRT